jgi:argininosuccinate lyase
MIRFNESLPFDKALHSVDIRGSVTFAKALQKTGLLTQDELEQIISGFQQVEKEWQDGKFVIKPDVDEEYVCTGHSGKRMTRADLPFV